MAVLVVCNYNTGQNHFLGKFSSFTLYHMPHLSVFYAPLTCRPNSSSRCQFCILASSSFSVSRMSAIGRTYGSTTVSLRKFRYSESRFFSFPTARNRTQRNQVIRWDETDGWNEPVDRHLIVCTKCNSPIFIY